MTQWILHSVIILTIAIWGNQYFKSSLNATTYYSALIMKLAAGVTLGLIFKYYYTTGDTFTFFDQAVTFSQLPTNQYLTELFTSSNYEVTNSPRVLFFTKFLSFFALITNHSYWISTLYLSLISFFCSCIVVRELTSIYSNLRHIIIISFLYVPTIVFWSAGLLKGTLAFSALSVLIAYAISTYKLGEWQWKKILIGLLAIFVLFKVKHYLLITFILFIGILAFLVLIRKNKRTKIAAIVVLILAAGATQLIHPYLRIDRLKQTLYDNNQAISQKTDAIDRLDIQLADPDVRSLLKVLPSSIKTGLFRPSIFDRTPFWGWLHKIENTLLSVLCIFSLLLLIKEKPYIDWKLVIAGIAAIMILSTMLAMSTPNFGTLVRYKNPMMPYFFLLVSALPYTHFTSHREE
ncbi:MAG: hypothetical protein Tsb0034_10920 [Ekhidna sp.]